MKLLKNKILERKANVPGVVIDISSRPRIFLLEVNCPLRTLGSVCKLLAQLGTEVISLQLTAQSVHSASLIIQLKIRHNIIHTFTESLSKIPGVLQVEWIER